MYGFLKIVFISITIGSVNLFSQWYKVTDPLFYQPISLDAYDDKSCIFSTSDDNGTLYITKDGGITWHKIVNVNGAGDSEISDVSMVNPYKIYLAAANGKIIATSNGGESWNIQFEDSTRTNCISYIEMFDENNGVAFGDAIETGFVEDIFFVNSDVGWAVNDFILKTIDGGETWIEQQKPSSNFRSSSIFFLNESLGWLQDRSILRKTTDGGNTWNIINSTASPSMLIFFDENNGFGFSNGVMKTTDGGVTWISTISKPGSIIRNFNFIDKDTGWFISSSSGKSTLFGTVNGGDEWTIIKTFYEETPRYIYFTDKNNGYTFYSKTYSLSDYRSYLLKTTDGGFNWSSTVFEDNNNDIYRLQVIKGDVHDTVFIFGSVSNFLKSTDNGITWESNNFEEYKTAGKIFRMINSNVGFTGCIHRSIFKTVNGGKSWNKKYQVVPTSAVVLNTTNGGQDWNYVDNNDMIGWGTVDYSRRIDFVDINTGYFKPMITYNPPPQTIFKTTNGGITWELTDLIVSMYALNFYNADFGMAAGFKVINNEIKGCVFITKDGSATFDTVLVGDGGSINSIEFHKNDPAKVWCSSVNGLFYSADSGKSWKEQSFLFSPKPRFRHIKFVDNSIGWIAANGFILRTTNAGGVFTSVENEISLPNNFQLYQNYPNPFNPTTTIEYSIPAEPAQRAVFTTLKIYDLLGSEVASLVNEIKSPGNYEVKFNGAGLPSGIYFYRLQAGGYTSTRKMLLIK
ncbi:MAG: YCF48-related protein [Melioribacteraceae bacterium]|nr:YCF48-related protein [Melioribacteraceae bacterium]